VKQKEEEGVPRERNLIKENASLYYIDARDIFSVDHESEFTVLKWKNVFQAEQVPIIRYRYFLIKKTG